MSKIFVTGATGQVGSHVVDYLLKEKKLGITDPKDIICLIRSPEKANGLESSGVSIVKGTLSDKSVIEQTMKNGIEYVFHVAANCSVNATEEEIHRPNVIGTNNMLEVFCNSNAHCFIYTSSIAVYDSFLGKKKKHVLGESADIGPMEGDPYAVSKRKAEKLVQDYQKSHPEKTFVITRLAPVIGAGDRQFVPTFVNLLSYRYLPKMVNKGRDVISIISPWDVARAQVFLAEIGEKVKGQAFNLAHETITYREFLTEIMDYYNQSPPKGSIPYWLFKLSIPFMRFFRIFLRDNAVLNNALSPIAKDYLGKTYIYRTEKIEDLGFSFKVSAEETIRDALKALDPRKELID
jgi:nucleoside-diphosphate-sugar epimerase